MDAADGHPVRQLDWSPPDAATGPRGSILFLPGRGDAYEKYLESFEHWRQRGWQVSAADWRGQAGSGRLGADEVTGHIDDFAIWVDDLAHLWAQWAATAPPPHILVGHSMGGHLVLRAAAEGVLNPAPAALILSAPMLEVQPERIPLAIRAGLARIMAAAGDPRRPAWKWSERPGEMPPDRQLLLTHDSRRYADELWWREQRPELVMGPGSWGWVSAALGSIRKLEQRGLLEGVDMPVLIFATLADPLVGNRAVQRAARRLPRAQTLFFGPEARHEILREVDAVRNQALDAVDAFLEPLAYHD